jgi:hypothetical protein
LLSVFNELQSVIVLLSAIVLSVIFLKYGFK